ncbi:Dgri\GH23625-PA-like protein [Anopheles sinensis]|uniref:Dgri\GH23625-PA-like protein n=1 Tax=Anopheles sinensis TaxID=74873 RepID=A0A084VBK4_ANOSI|nr:Dgri\GH23625-PA-like protein [Anopheles sinensis]
MCREYLENRGQRLSSDNEHTRWNHPRSIVPRATSVYVHSNLSDRLRLRRRRADPLYPLHNKKLQHRSSYRHLIGGMHDHAQQQTPQPSTGSRKMSSHGSSINVLRN